jgi:hypothetical protein
MPVIYSALLVMLVTRLIKPKCLVNCPVDFSKTGDYILYLVSLQKRKQINKAGLYPHPFFWRVPLVLGPSLEHMFRHSMHLDDKKRGELIKSVLFHPQQLRHLRKDFVDLFKKRKHFTIVLSCDRQFTIKMEYFPSLNSEFSMNLEIYHFFDGKVIWLYNAKPHLNDLMSNIQVILNLPDNKSDISFFYIQRINIGFMTFEVKAVSFFLNETTSTSEPEPIPHGFFSSQTSCKKRFGAELSSTRQKMVCNGLQNAIFEDLSHRIKRVSLANQA